jgi:hypothetical protein
MMRNASGSDKNADEVIRRFIKQRSKLGTKNLGAKTQAPLIIDVVAVPTGLEPVTFGLGNRCSIR